MEEAFVAKKYWHLLGGTEKKHKILRIADL
jgi:hypothetical protein